MLKHLHALDWKVTLFVSLACFVLPRFLFGTVIWSALGSEVEQTQQSLVAVLLAANLILAPTLAGYLVARYATALPQMHVALIGLIAVAVYGLSLSAPWLFQIALCVAVFLLSSLGGFIWLRRHPSRAA